LRVACALQSVSDGVGELCLIKLEWTDTKVKEILTQAEFQTLLKLR